jgi:hypothetical protein
MWRTMEKRPEINLAPTCTPPAIRALCGRELLSLAQTSSESAQSVLAPASSALASVFFTGGPPEEYQSAQAIQTDLSDCRHGLTL